MSKESAELLKKTLKENGLKQKDFCEITGLSRSSIYKYLRGRPIHRKAAAKIESSFLSHTPRIFIPKEKLID